MAHQALEINDADPPELRLVKTIARSNWGRARRAESQNDKILADIAARLERIERELKEIE